jgi:RNA polymerase sigma-70 factor (ECF subfamily)
VNLRDPEAYEAVYATHARRVYANAFRILRDAAKAEDAVQDVFLRLWLHPERFDERRGDLGGYLALMARSRALDIARSDAAASRAGERLTAAVEAEPPRAERPDERVEQHERATGITANRRASR